MAKRQSVIREFLSFTMANKKWWLIPIALIMGALAVLAFLGSTPVAPFVYTIF